MYGNDFAYAQSRIQGTILRVKKTGEPVYVYIVNGGGQCSVTPIERDWGGEATVTMHVDDLDMHPVPLGYVNSAGEATYLMRVPMRRDWKQGLRQENCWSSGRRLNSIPMKDLKNCIIGRFPSFETALKDVVKSGEKAKNKIIAWHRHWAVSTDGRVFYKNHEQVGTILDGHVDLFPSHKYLAEVLEESFK